jgi:hypothetical protein
LTSKGVSAGTIYIGNTTVASRWDSSGHRTALIAPSGATSTEATAIDEDGTVVGVATFDGNIRAVRWSPSGVPTLLAMPDNANYSSATQIENGVMIGNVRINNLFRIIRWDSPSSYTVLPLSSDLGAQVNALDISNGKICGTATDTFGSSGSARPIVYDDMGVARALSVGTAGAGHVRSINSSGVVAGTLQDFNHGARLSAVRWDANGDLQYLNEPDGANNSSISQMESNGISVGQVTFGDGSVSSPFVSRATLWSNEGDVAFVDDLLVSADPWRSTSGESINGDFITVRAIDPFSKAEVAVLLTAVPEPSGSLYLAASAILLIRRNRRAGR